MGRWLLRWAPGLSLKHVNFAEETMAKHNFNPDRLRPADVMQLMYMFGFNPTATAMGAPTCRSAAARQCVLRWLIVDIDVPESNSESSPTLSSLPGATHLVSVGSGRLSAEPAGEPLLASCIPNPRGC